VPSALEARPDLAPGIDTVLARALAKDPADRYTTAQAFIEDLARLASVAIDQPTIQLAGHVARRGAGRRILADVGLIRTFAIMGVAFLMVISGVWVLSRPGGQSPTAGGTGTPTTSPFASDPAWITPRPGLALQYEPAALVSHASGATLDGASVTFAWSLAVGPTHVRYVGLYVGSTPPVQPCAAIGYCQEGPDDPAAAYDIAVAGGNSDGQRSATVSGLPDDGSTVYVRLFTKYETEHGYDPAIATPSDDGLFAWRDYTFASGTGAVPTMTPAPSPIGTTRSSSTPTKKPTPAPTPTKQPTPAPTAGFNPARLTGITNGATVHGTSVTFFWTEASGPGSVRFYGIMADESPPPYPCAPGAWCDDPNEDPPDRAEMGSSYGCGCGLTSDQSSFTFNALPADGSIVYIRLFTKWNPDNGEYAWRDYTFTSQP
jgi:hypothetical protein